MNSTPACLVLAEEVWGSTLHAIRSLDAAGAAVLVATAGRGSHVFGRSRCRPSVVDLDQRGGPEFLRQALSWATEQAPTAQIVVIPTSDRTTAAMHHHRAMLDGFRPILAPPAALDQLLDKANSMRAAEAAGLAVPPWRLLTTIADVNAIEDLHGPVVLKPESWASSRSAGFKIEVHANAHAATAAARTALEAGATLIAQEYRQVPVESVEFAVTWRSHDGTISAVCTGRKRRQSSPDGGVMAWGESVQLPDVAAEAMTFMDSTGFTGPGGIEFLRTERGLEFVEFNPRLEAIHFLAGASGIDVVRLAYDDVGLDVLPAADPAASPAAAWVGGAWLQRIQRHPGDWRLLIRDRASFARASRRSRAVLSWHDPAPAAALAVTLANSAARRLTHRGTA